MTARAEQSHQLQQPEADSAIQREADRVVPENTGQSVGRVDYPDVFEQVWRECVVPAIGADEETWDHMLKQIYKEWETV